MTIPTVLATVALILAFLTWFEMWRGRYENLKLTQRMARKQAQVLDSLLEEHEASTGHCVHNGLPKYALDHPEWPEQRCVICLGILKAEDL